MYANAFLMIADDNSSFAVEAAEAAVELNKDSNFEENEPFVVPLRVTDMTSTSKEDLATLVVSHFHNAADKDSNSEVTLTLVVSYEETFEVCQKVVAGAEPAAVEHVVAVVELEGMDDVDNFGPMVVRHDVGNFVQLEVTNGDELVGVKSDDDLEELAEMNDAYSCSVESEELNLGNSYFDDWKIYDSCVVV
jgi:hypothetical protein